MVRRFVTAASIAAALLASGCSKDPVVSDTGYVGTWSRGNDRVTSLVAIVREGDAYRVRVHKYSADGKFLTTCDWDGSCVETKEGKKIAEIRYRFWTEPASGHLFVAYDEKRFDQGEGPGDMTQTDELVVENGGLELLALTRKRNDQTFDGPTPKRSFQKVSNSVAFPPSVRYR